MDYPGDYETVLLYRWGDPERATLLRWINKCFQAFFGRTGLRALEWELVCFFEDFFFVRFDWKLLLKYGTYFNQR